MLSSFIFSLRTAPAFRADPLSAKVPILIRYHFFPLRVTDVEVDSIPFFFNFLTRSSAQALFVVDAAAPTLAGADLRGAFDVTPLYVVPSQAERVAGIDLGLTGVDDS